MKPKELPYTVSSNQEEWEHIHNLNYSASTVSVLKMKANEVLKVYHPDSYCDGNQCALASAVRKQKKLGKWSFKHLAIGVALVRRVK